MIFQCGLLAKGDLVVNTLDNSPERVVTDVGLLMVGAAAVHGQCFMADGEDLIRYAGRPIKNII